MYLWVSYDSQNSDISLNSINWSL